MPVAISALPEPSRATAATMSVSLVFREIFAVRMAAFRGRVKCGGVLAGEGGRDKRGKTSGRTPDQHILASARGERVNVAG